MIKVKHFLQPVEAEDGTLKNAFLAVINTEPDNERTIARVRITTLSPVASTSGEIVRRDSADAVLSRRGSF